VSDRYAALARAVPGFARGTALSVPGVWDGLSKRLVEQAGFACAFLSGGALSMARYGWPDIGLVTLSELATTVAVIRETSDLPLIVDADTGFGNALNAQRTMRLLEAAGATAIQIEDQAFPKRCGHMAGKAVIGPSEYARKLKAVLDARRGGTLVIARTDARSVEGFEATMDRAMLYLETGADLLFVEGPHSRAEMEAISKEFGDRVPLVHNLVEGGVSPVASAAELSELGYAIGLHPLIMLHGFVRQAPGLLAHLRTAGSTTGLDIADLPEMNRLLDTAGILEAAKAHDPPPAGEGDQA
jgi:2-methylisocitrate lyase-like PEP mutase family enzyme